MKKYILILLLCGIAKGQTNLFVRQNFATGNPTANTFIGGVSSTISTPALLATKLGISGSRISNFKVVGSDIQCRISGSYAIPGYSFYFISSPYAPASYYKDIDGLVTSVGYWAFYYGGSNGALTSDIEFKNAITLAASVFSTGGKRILLKNANTIGNACFYGSSTLEVIYIPNVTTIGADVGMQDGDYQRVFLLEGLSFANLKIYAHPSMATINAGGVEGDLANAISRGATVRYVTNFTPPNPITTLASGTVTSTTIQLNFTPPTGSTNAIDYYEVWLNGVDSGKTLTASGQNVTGLTTATSYDIELITVDIFYNKSVKSNKITVSTL